MSELIIVTVAIVVDESRILLVKRAREPYKGLWSFISGSGAFCHTSDSIEAVKMEVQADINCEFKPSFFTYCYTNFQTPTVTLFFYGTIESVPKINLKYVSKCRWFDANKITGVELGFDHREILKKFLKEKGFL